MLNFVYSFTIELKIKIQELKTQPVLSVGPILTLLYLWKVRTTTIHLELSWQRFQWKKLHTNSIYILETVKTLQNLLAYYILHTIREFFKIYWKIQDPHIKTTNPFSAPGCPLFLVWISDGEKDSELFRGSSNEDSYWGWFQFAQWF